MNSNWKFGENTQHSKRGRVGGREGGREGGRGRERGREGRREGGREGEGEREGGKEGGREGEERGLKDLCEGRNPHTSALTDVPLYLFTVSSLSILTSRHATQSEEKYLRMCTCTCTCMCV